MSTLGLGLNTGSYFGSGYVSSGYSSGIAGSSRPASYTNINRVSTNIASGYSADFEIIAQYMKKGETDKALRLYEALFDDAQATANLYGYTLSDSEVESILNAAYQKTTGTTMTSAVTKNTSGAFMSGMAQGLPIVGLFMNGTNEDEALSTLSGEKNSTNSEAKEYIGAALSGAATGAAIGTALGSWTLGAATIVGGIVGGAVGLAQTFLKDLF